MQQQSDRALIHVMAGAVSDGAGRILIAKRPDRVHQGGLWEFPGGKLEPGESPAQGLARELDEELGIRVVQSRPLIRVRHDYGDRRVLLDVHRVDGYDGIPRGREGQPLAWQDPRAMDPKCFPAADRPIITALRLPPWLMITGGDPLYPDAFLQHLGCAIEDGVRLVQLRAHSIDDATYRGLARRAHALCERLGAQLLLNRDPSALADVPRHGLHLSGHALSVIRERPGRSDELVGASCHGRLDLVRAAQLGLDYALLSPVKSTATHPEALPLGWQAFADCVDAVSIPVYALGGLTRGDLDDAIVHGGQGIAAIRDFWPGPDRILG